MERPGPNDHPRIPGREFSRGGDAPRQPVLGPLVDLVTDLKRIESNDPPSSGTDQSIAIWWDDHDIYIESNIIISEDFDIDISLFDGKFLIRLSRRNCPG